MKSWLGIRFLILIYREHIGVYVECSRQIAITKAARKNTTPLENSDGKLLAISQQSENKMEFSAHLEWRMEEGVRKRRPKVIQFHNNKSCLKWGRASIGLKSPGIMS